MKSDIDRWNRKFAGREVGDEPTPDPLLTRCPYLPPGGRALDVASGSGNNAVWLAQHGFDVTAIDGSVEGMRLAMALAARRGVRIRPIVADLDRVTLAGVFDLVIVMHYLNRPLYRSLHDRLAPGGVLIAKTFNRDFLESRPGFNEDFVLATGELCELFGDLEVLDHAESPPSQRGKSHIVCRRR
ncbi:MAG: class I SAM-dependent methyltransferase [Proteobacteria bacterium]|nr:MAG: class I SAM-dependent methyltransferase [Pseudomonadota bacterium]